MTSIRRDDDSNATLPTTVIPAKAGRFWQTKVCLIQCPQAFGDNKPLGTRFRGCDENYSGQQCSALGLTPREYSSGGTRKLGRITKQGDVYLRTLLIHGARSALLVAASARKRGQPLDRTQQWALALAERKGHNKAAVALANKVTRRLWAPKFRS